MENNGLSFIEDKYKIGFTGIIREGNPMDSTIQKIEKARDELIELGTKRGFQDPKVIEKSQMLDELINQYYRLTPTPSQVKAAS